MRWPPSLPRLPRFRKTSTSTARRDLQACFTFRPHDFCISLFLAEASRLPTHSNNTSRYKINMMPDIRRLLGLLLPQVLFFLSSLTWCNMIVVLELVIKMINLLTFSPVLGNFGGSVFNCRSWHLNLFVFYLLQVDSMVNYKQQVCNKQSYYH